MNYTITDLGAESQWVVTMTNDASNDFVEESESLAAALAYLATVLNFGDIITYVDEPLAP